MAKICLPLLFVAAASSFGASLTFYTSESAFQAAITGLPQQTITFDSIATGEYSPLIANGVSFAGDLHIVGNPNDETVSVRSQTTWTLPFFGSATGNSLASLDSFVVTLPSGVVAVGFLVGSSVVSVLNISVQEALSTGTASTIVTASPLDLFPFVGVVADGPISSITIHGPSLVTIDNVTFASVPEPATGVLLFCSLLLAVPAIRRLRNWN